MISKVISLTIALILSWISMTILLEETVLAASLVAENDSSNVVIAMHSSSQDQERLWPWQVHPQYYQPDGLSDYNEDFSGAADGIVASSDAKNAIDFGREEPTQVKTVTNK